MKKMILISGVLLFLIALIYTDYQYGLRSILGLNGKGLPAKTVKGSLVNTSEISTIRVDHSKWTALLKRYVTDEGQVNYRGFLKDKSKLSDYLNALATQVPTNAWSVQEQLAYYINLYNAQTVNLILRNYPLKSIKDIDRPWAKDFIQIEKKKLSLGALEHSILRRMNEPRIHFAINCASASCPKLINEAFTADKLDEQLEKVTLDFITSDNNTISKDKVELSRIFKWYKGDFKSGDIKQFIDSYSEVKIGSKVKINYKEYNWSLNEVYY